jgi:hypothetical protein
VAEKKFIYLSSCSLIDAHRIDLGAIYVKVLDMPKDVAVSLYVVAH